MSFLDLESNILSQHGIKQKNKRVPKVLFCFFNIHFTQEKLDLFLYFKCINAHLFVGFTRF